MERGNDAKRYFSPSEEITYYVQAQPNYVRERYWSRQI